MPPQQNYRLHDTTNSTYFSATKNDTQNDNNNKVAEAGACDINEVGLENFIRKIVTVLNLNLGDDVIFNLNDRGIIHKW
eukprot:CAMPEP_0194254312 /NCGR_PEP_ID=MMETSP0158-20130606/31827_1 /TAXON_ID=33649 /ORGANISM="Thalassionema nitzschioides, Strain L26-B" /LENGTH=78 /DNA_ID=CAMNT_0038992287 /DNA_START=27 /DNA_END=260 /DNA_ORIENTATION=-